ncbi:MAG TPA: serine/threonine-protein kinase [Polyangiaceae bacterium]
MSDEIERLLAPDTPIDEAMRVFAHLRTTPDEARAIQAVLARSAYAAVPEPLVVAAASALVDRGDPSGAERVLAGLSSTPALVLRADLLAGDAGPGARLAEAVALVERVLLRDIDWPGARERHERWRRGLVGVSEPVRHRDAGATLVTSQPKAPFRLVRETGRGGSGVVYEAQDAELGRAVALKVYHRPDRDRAQLLHEGRVAVQLAGRGIVRVFDVDPAQGWLAMEWASLGALRARIQEADAASLLPVARWALPLARALARVHAAGWVHHDVKPANVLLRASDDPLLTDFGTARRVGEPSPPGSMGYVSPERLAGRASDPRDDVYGYGRVIEDALRAVQGVEQVEPLWRDLWLSCTGPSEGRPLDGGALLALIELSAD